MQYGIRTSDLACAYVGPATHACLKLYMWDLSLGIEIWKKCVEMVKTLGG